MGAQCGKPDREERLRRQNFLRNSATSTVILDRYATLARSGSPQRPASALPPTTPDPTLRRTQSTDFHFKSSSSSVYPLKITPVSKGSGFSDILANYSSSVPRRASSSGFFGSSSQEFSASSDNPPQGSSSQEVLPSQSVGVPKRASSLSYVSPHSNVFKRPSDYQPDPVSPAHSGLFDTFEHELARYALESAQEEHHEPEFENLPPVTPPPRKKRNRTSSNASSLDYSVPDSQAPEPNYQGETTQDLEYLEQDSFPPVAPPPRKKRPRSSSNASSLASSRFPGEEEAPVPPPRKRVSPAASLRRLPLLPEVVMTKGPEHGPKFVREMNDVVVKVGTRGRLLVEVDPNFTDSEPDSLNITWTRNNVPVSSQDPSTSRVRQISEGRFHYVDISQVLTEDEATWTCTAENLRGRTSCSCHLKVMVPKSYRAPEFVEGLRAVLTEAGTVSLECKVIGTPTPLLKWYKDGIEIKAGDIFALRGDPSSLGVYTCEATNCMGSITSSSRVHVHDPHPASKLHITSPLQDLRIRVGERADLTLTLSTDVPDTATVTWYNKSSIVSKSERVNPRVEKNLVGLHLNPVEVSQDGEWVCEVGIGSEKHVSSCVVSIVVPRNYRKPKFLEDLKAILTDEGLVSFECKVCGFPTPILHWFKDGYELKPGDVYQLSGANSLGRYSCIAHNCMGDAESSTELTLEDIQHQLSDDERKALIAEGLSSKRPPRFITGLKSVEHKIGDPCELSVELNDPNATIQWVKAGTEIGSTDPKYVLRRDGARASIVIKELEFEDQETWKCNASNEYGVSVSTACVRLIIPPGYKKPKFLENLRAVLSEEGTVNLECKVIGVPVPLLKWYKDGVELKAGDIHRIISGADGTCCLGTYTCVAKNCMGEVSSSAALLGFEDKLEKDTSGQQASISSSSAAGAAAAAQQKHNLTRDPSLSTIMEERTSQMLSVYETPNVPKSIEEEDGNVSVSIDGKDVSVSLYETPDLTENDAKQIIEMFANEYSEYISEHGVVPLPSLRFVKETSTSGNIIMEAVVIDVTDDPFDTAKSASMGGVLREDPTENDYDEFSDSFESPLEYSDHEHGSIRSRPGSLREKRKHGESLSRRSSEKKRREQQGIEAMPVSREELELFGNENTSLYLSAESERDDVRVPSVQEFERLIGESLMPAYAGFGVLDSVHFDPFSLARESVIDGDEPVVPHVSIENAVQAAGQFDNRVFSNIEEFQDYESKFNAEEVRVFGGEKFVGIEMAEMVLEGADTFSEVDSIPGTAGVEKLESGSFGGVVEVEEIEPIPVKPVRKKVEEKRAQSGERRNVEEKVAVQVVGEMAIEASEKRDEVKVVSQELGEGGTVKGPEQVPEAPKRKARRDGSGTREEVVENVETPPVQPPKRKHSKDRNSIEVQEIVGVKRVEVSEAAQPGVAISSGGKGEEVELMNVKEEKAVISGVHESEQLAYAGGVEQTEQEEKRNRDELCGVAGKVETLSGEEKTAMKKSSSVGAGSVQAAEVSTVVTQVPVEGDVKGEIKSSLGVGMKHSEQEVVEKSKTNQNVENAEKRENSKETEAPQDQVAKGKMGKEAKAEKEAEVETKKEVKKGQESVDDTQAKQTGKLAKENADTDKNLEETQKEKELKGKAEGAYEKDNEETAQKQVREKEAKDATQKADTKGKEKQDMETQQKSDDPVNEIVKKETEVKEKEAKEKAEKEMKEKAEQKKKELESKEKENIEKVAHEQTEQEKKELSSKEKTEKDKLAKEMTEKAKQEKEADEQGAKEKSDKQDMKKINNDAQQKAEKEAKDAAQKEKEAKDAAQKEKEAKEKELKEKEAKDKTEKEKKENDAKTKQEKEAKEKIEKEAKEIAEKEIKEKVEKEKNEKEAKEKAENEKKEKEAKEKAQKEKEAKEKAEKEKIEKETKEKAEKENKEKEAKEKAEKEKKEKEAKEKAEHEKKEKDAKEMAEKEKKEKDAKEMAEKEKKEKEAKEKKEKEAKEKAENEKKEKEAKEKAEKEKKEKEAKEKAENEKKEKEAKEKAEKEKKEKEAKEKAEKEKKEKEAKEKAENEKKEKEAKEKAEKEKKEKEAKEKEKKEKEAKEKAEKEKKEKEAKEKAEKEKKEKEAKEKAENEKKEKEAKEKAENEKKEKEAKEMAEKEKRDKEAKENAEKEKKEKAEKEAKVKAEQEKKEKQEKEAKEKKDKEAKEKAEQEKQEKEAKEKAENEAKEKKEKEAKEKTEKEKKEKETKEKQEKEAKEKAEKEAKEKKEKEAKETAEKEKKEKEAKEKKEKEAKEKKEKEAKEKKEKEAKEKEAKEKQEKEAKEKKEKEAKEKQEKEAKEKAEQEKKGKEFNGKADQEKETKEKAEKDAKEKLEKEKDANDKAETADKMPKEKEANEKKEKDAKEKTDQVQKEKKAQENAEKEAKEKAAKEQKENDGKEKTKKDSVKEGKEKEAEGKTSTDKEKGDDKGKNVETSKNKTDETKDNNAEGKDSPTSGAARTGVPNDSANDDSAERLIGERKKSEQLIEAKRASLEEPFKIKTVKKVNKIELQSLKLEGDKVTHTDSPTTPSTPVEKVASPTSSTPVEKTSSPAPSTPVEKVASPTSTTPGNKAAPTEKATESAAAVSKPTSPTEKKPPSTETTGSKKIDKPVAKKDAVPEPVVEEQTLKGTKKKSEPEKLPEAKSDEVKRVGSQKDSQEQSPPAKEPQTPPRKLSKKSSKGEEAKGKKKLAPKEESKSSVDAVKVETEQVVEVQAQATMVRSGTGEEEAQIIPTEEKIPRGEKEKTASSVVPKSATPVEPAKEKVEHTQGPEPKEPLKPQDSKPNQSSQRQLEDSKPYVHKVPSTLVPEHDSRVPDRSRTPVSYKEDYVSTHHETSSPHQSYPSSHHETSSPRQSYPSSHHDTSSPRQSYPSAHHDTSSPRQSYPSSLHPDYTPQRSTPTPHQSSSSTLPRIHESRDTTTPSRQYIPRSRDATPNFRITERAKSYDHLPGYYYGQDTFSGEARGVVTCGGRNLLAPGYSASVQSSTNLIQRTRDACSPASISRSQVSLDDLRLEDQTRSFSRELRQEKLKAMSLSRNWNADDRDVSSPPPPPRRRRNNYVAKVSSEAEDIYERTTAPGPLFTMPSYFTTPSTGYSYYSSSNVYTSDSKLSGSGSFAGLDEAHRMRRPRFSMKLQHRTTPEQTEVVKFACTVFGTPEPSIQWYKNGIPIFSDRQKYVITSSCGVCTLDIKDVDKQDTGEYTCFARNFYGKAASSAILQVVGVDVTARTAIPADPKSHGTTTTDKCVPVNFTTAIIETHFADVNELVLECQVKGSPRPEVSWVKNGSTIISYGQQTYGRFRADYANLFDTGKCRLIIQRPRESDSGVYTCVGRNYDHSAVGRKLCWTDEITKCVNVKFAGPVSPKGGVYGIASSSYPASSSFEYQAPRFITELEPSKRVKVGDEIALTVEITGVPQPEVRWFHHKNTIYPIVPSSHTRVINEAPGTHTLYIPNVDPFDFGTYTVRVTNKYGLVESSCSVTEYITGVNDSPTLSGLRAGRKINDNAVPPRFVRDPRENCLLKYGDDLVIECEVEGWPQVSVNLYRGCRNVTLQPRAYKELVPPVPQSHTNTNQNVKFTLSNLNCTDFGMYTVEVKNISGSAKAFVNVKLFDPNNLQHPSRSTRSMTPGHCGGSSGLLPSHSVRSLTPGPSIHPRPYVPNPNPRSISTRSLLLGASSSSLSSWYGPTLRASSPSLRKLSCSSHMLLRDY